MPTDLGFNIVAVDKFSRTFDKASKGMGKTGKALLAVGAAAAAGAAAAGVALGKIGSDFDKASDTIRVGTGATGDQLAELEQSFKNVVKDVPADFGDASTAIADLNTRTGATGPQLEKLSGQFLELSRITKTDVGGNIEAVTRVFGDWDIAVEDQAGSLDKLFRTSQATGIGVDGLAQKVVQFGAPLRQLGFEFEESIGLLGKWEKEGVNVEAVLSGMKIGLGKFAEAGEEPARAMERITKEIKNAGSAGQANQIAIEAFGQRAGPDMAAAIQEGRFELGDLLSTINGGKDTIMGAGKDTQSFQEKLTLLKNKAFVALEPIATKVFDLLTTGAEKLGPLVEGLGEGLEVFFAAFSGQSEMGEFEGHLGTVNDIGIKVRDVVDEIGAFISDKLVPAFKAVGGFIGDKVVPVISSLFGWISKNKEILPAVAIAIGVLLVPAFISWAVAAGAAAIATITAAAPVILIGVLVAALAFLIIKHWDKIKEVTVKVFKSVWEFLKGLWENITGAISTAIDFVKKLFFKFTPLGIIIKNWEPIWTFIKDLWDKALRFIKKIPDKIKGFFKGMWDPVASGAKAAINGAISLINGAIGGINTLIRGANKLPGVSIPQVGSIPFLAKGGIVTRPTLAMLGERGPEAVVPLDRGGHGASVTVNVNGAVGDPVQIARMIQAELVRLQRSGLRLGFS